MKLTYAWGLLLILTLVSCKNENKELYKRVMDTHDEVMPRMGEIERLKRELRDKISKSPDMIQERKEKLEQIISNLDSASRSMMDWMHKFNPLPDTADQAKAKSYLEAEMVRIEKVKELMLQSIQEANEALKEQ